MQGSLVVRTFFPHFCKHFIVGSEHSWDHLFGVETFPETGQLEEPVEECVEHAFSHVFCWEIIHFVLFEICVIVLEHYPQMIKDFIPKHLLCRDRLELWSFKVAALAVFKEHCSHAVDVGLKFILLGAFIGNVVIDVVLCVALESVEHLSDKWIAGVGA